MKIAVTYENGNVFQHFGRTEQFKVYTAEDGKVIASEVISSNGIGHGALAGLLAQQDIDVLICGGMGAGAKNALMNGGIEICSGAQGDADQAVEAYLKGELTSADITCDHHDHHGEDHECCGEHDEDHACCGHCAEPAFTGKNVGKKVRVHYKGTLNDGTQFDSSYDRGQPLEFVCGAGMMIKGFDAAVADMEIGETKNVHLKPEEAYGMPDPRQVFTVPMSELPGSEGLEKGQRIYLQDISGRAFPVTVTEKTDTMITFDANHEMAGKELNFLIELVEVL